MHQEKSRLAEFAFVLGLVLVFALASPRIVRSLKHANSDFFSFWLAGRMVWEDQDPYDSDLWIDGHQANGAEWVSDDTFIYPLPLSLAFAPIGLLRMFGAYSLWMFLSLLAVVGSLVLLGVIWTRQSLGLSEMIPIFLGVLLFRPFLVTVRNGQLGAFLVLLLVVVLVLWEREQWLSGGMVLGAILL